MTERTSYAPGTPSWVDLSTTDTEVAKTFYGQLFGWEFEGKSTGDDGTYTMATIGGKNVAGLMAQQPDQAGMGIPSMWNSYVTVADIEASVQIVPTAGGSVMMPPTLIPEVGSMAVIVDPTGAVICLWEPLARIGAELVNEHGALCWNDLITSDVPAASKFYETLFGWTAEDGAMMEAGQYTLFTLDGEAIGGSPGMPDAGIPPHWSTVFAINDCEKAVASIPELGGTVLAPPFDTPIGRIAVLADPTGAAFQLIELAEQPS